MKNTFSGWRIIFFCWKTMESLRNHRNIKLVTTKKEKLLGVRSKSSTFLTENLLAVEMTKTRIFINNPVYLGLSILDLSKTAMYGFWYDYVKAK